MSDRVFSVTASTLRLRQAPHTSAAIMARLARGQLVARLDLIDRAGWWRVFADTPGEGAHVGYVSAAWLARWADDAIQAPPPPAPAAPTAPEPAPEPAPTAEPSVAAAMTEDGFAAATDQLGVGLAELWAVLEVEARGEGFFTGGDKHRLPQILYERHKFSHYSNHAWDATHPEISSPTGYTHDNEAHPNDRYGSLDGQYPRLVAAAALDREAALKSASWGIGQIMGFNHQAVGYSDVEAMVADMRVSEDLQLRAFARFLISERLTEPLRKHDWAAFAAGYNGPAYERYDYHGKLQRRFEALVTRTPNVLLREAQVYLKFLGKYKYKADGLWGNGSRGAVKEFLEKRGETVSDDALAQTPGPDFLRALIAEAAPLAAQLPINWPLPPPPDAGVA